MFSSDFRLGRGLALALMACGGCSGPQASSPGPRTPAPEPAAVAAPAPAEASLELTADEVVVRDRLATHVARLEALGERGAKHPWALADGVEYITAYLEASGVPIVRGVVEVDGVVFQRITAAVAGAEGETGAYMVVAPYDSEAIFGASAQDQTPARRNALGAAAILELARLLSPAALQVPLQLILVTSPLGADRAPALQRLVVDSQGQQPRGVLWLGDGLDQAVVHLDAFAMGGEGLAPALESAVIEELSEVPLGPESIVRGAVDMPPELPAFPGISVSLLHGSAQNSPNSSLAHAAIRVARLRAALSSLLGERPTNDTMVTPLYPAGG